MSRCNRAPSFGKLGFNDYVNELYLFERIAVLLCKAVADILGSICIQIYILVQVIIPETMLKRSPSHRCHRRSTDG